jgi:uncharacterized membrane protein YccF (DUF307 family)
MALLRTLLNLVWLVLAGVWMALGYVVAGLICCVLIITIPWGIASFRIALFALWPFGSRIERRGDAGLGSTLGNIIWFVVAGWWLALGHVVTAIALAVTIIGIPFAWANLKLIPVSLTPLGRRIVDTEDAAAFAVGDHRTPVPTRR